MFGFGRFLCLFIFINAVAILNEERFLEELDWATANPHAQIMQQHNSCPYANSAVAIIWNSLLKSKADIIDIFHTNILRIPLIVINLLVIIYRLIFD